MTRSIISQTEVAPGVHFVQGPASNWTVLVGDGSVALIDAGYPADLRLVEESMVRAGGQPAELSAVLITHGHSDHIGTVGRLVDKYGVRVFGHSAELANIDRSELHQIRIVDILPNLWRPRVARWVVGAVADGGLGDVGVPSVETIPDGPVNFAGHVVEAVPLAGHTPGHTGYLLPEDGVLVTGDALVTAHPTVRANGPQLLAPMWHSAPDSARSALSDLSAIHAETILPGHGPLLRMSPAEAASISLSSAR